jgi:predicted small metal-binding protein
MAGVTEYKEFSCRDVDAECYFMVRAETENEVLQHYFEHGCSNHAQCKISPEIEKKVKSLIKNVWIANGRFLEG